MIGGVVHKYFPESFFGIILSEHNYEDCIGYSFSARKLSLILKASVIKLGKLGVWLPQETNINISAGTRQN